MRWEGDFEPPALPQIRENVEFYNPAEYAPRAILTAEVYNFVLDILYCSDCSTRDRFLRGGVHCDHQNDGSD